MVKSKGFLNIFFCNKFLVFLCGFSLSTIATIKIPNFYTMPIPPIYFTILFFCSLGLFANIKNINNYKLSYFYFPISVFIILFLLSFLFISFIYNYISFSKFMIIINLASVFLIFYLKFTKINLLQIIYFLFFLFLLIFIGMSANQNLTKKIKEAMYDRVLLVKTPYYLLKKFPYGLKTILQNVKSSL